MNFKKTIPTTCCPPVIIIMFKFIAIINALIIPSLLLPPALLAASAIVGQAAQQVTFTTNNCHCTLNCTQLAQANATDTTCHLFVEKGCCNECDFYGRPPGRGGGGGGHLQSRATTNGTSQYRGPDGFDEFRKQVCDTYKSELKINGNRCEESREKRKSLPILVPKLNVTLEPTTRSMLLRLRGSCQSECEQYVKPNVTSNTVYDFVAAGCCSQCPGASNQVTMMRNEVCHLYQANLKKRESQGSWENGQWVLPKLEKLDVELSPSTKTALMPCGDCDKFAEDTATSDMVYDFVSQHCCGGCYTPKGEVSHFKEQVCRVYGDADRERTNSGSLSNGKWVLPDLKRINLTEGFKSIMDMLPAKCGDNCDDYAHPTPEGIYRFVGRGCCSSCNPGSEEELPGERGKYLSTFRNDVCSSYKDALKRQLDNCRWVNGSWIKPELERVNVTISPKWNELLKPERRIAPCETTTLVPATVKTSGALVSSLPSPFIVTIFVVVTIICFKHKQ